MSARSHEGQPLVLLSDTQRLGAAVDGLVKKGWSVREGFSLADRDWRRSVGRVVCAGSVESPGDAAAAVLAAARGAGLVVAVLADPATKERLFEDLSRLGPVELDPEQRQRSTDLPPEQRRVLELLAAGTSLDDIARTLNFSRRTIERRLADAQASMGARTSAEALTIFERKEGHR